MKTIVFHKKLKGFFHKGSFVFGSSFLGSFSIIRGGSRGKSGFLPGVTLHFAEAYSTYFVEVASLTLQGVSH